MRGIMMDCPKCGEVFSINQNGRCYICDSPLIYHTIHVTITSNAGE